MCNSLRLMIIFIINVAAVEALAAVNVKEQQSKTDQDVKLRALQVIKEAGQLVQDVSYPEKDRLQIYLSHGQGKYFSVEKVIVQVDGEDKTTFNYNKSQQTALLRGGANRLYIGSVSEGIHEVVVVFYGYDRQSNVIKKAQTWLFDKKPGAVIALIKVSDNAVTHRPDFKFKVIQGK